MNTGTAQLCLPSDDGDDHVIYDDGGHVTCGDDHDVTFDCSVADDESSAENCGFYSVYYYRGGAVPRFATLPHLTVATFVPYRRRSCSCYCYPYSYHREWRATGSVVSLAEPAVCSLSSRRHRLHRCCVAAEIETDTESGL